LLIQEHITLSGLSQKLGFGFLWLAFVGYAFGLAPPDQPDTLTLIQNLSTGNWQGINLWVVTLFNLMGIWPMVYTSLLLGDGRLGETRRLRAWPFAVGSFAVGAFAILPYLALRQPQSGAVVVKPSWGLRLVESRWLGVLLLVATLGLLSIGVRGGDWAEFGQLWQTRRFIHVMSLDFCLLSLLAPVVVKADLVRRGVTQKAWLGLALVPMLGPLAYLCLRPPRAQMSESQR
jgi:hypothetical protein